ncbi:hypothetical protein VTO42DRAFT_2895 [Malbranchea cinnamomea]
MKPAQRRDYSLRATEEDIPAIKSIDNSFTTHGIFNVKLIWSVDGDEATSSCFQFHLRETPTPSPIQKVFPADDDDDDEEDDDDDEDVEPTTAATTTCTASKQKLTSTLVTIARTERGPNNTRTLCGFIKTT